MWRAFKYNSKLILLQEIAIFLLMMAAIYGLFILAYGFIGSGDN